ncbi:MAG: TIGR04283 family arsenosugar biosynthesis glycosyltransferase, partial [Syntrophales bacterium]|nr:TIGR04283 family arsenosugar biosynthesis glycosyltransferase [Syntrophales bacterium]
MSNPKDRSGGGRIKSKQLAVSSEQKKRNSHAKLTLSPGYHPIFSIIIPVYNEAGVLGKTLAALPGDRDLEIIVVDGGSTDGSREEAENFPQARLLQAPKSRGAQMNAGAQAARGDFLVFLHADTILEAAHLAAIRRAAADPAFSAGAFEIQFTPRLPAFRFISWGANLRSRIFGFPYGDQALILRRDLFDFLGGFSSLRPEDLDLMLRLRPHLRVRILTPPVVTSSRKWLEQGYFETTMK